MSHMDFESAPTIPLYTDFREGPAIFVSLFELLMPEWIDEVNLATIDGPKPTKVFTTQGALAFVQSPTARAFFLDRASASKTHGQLIEPIKLKTSTKGYTSAYGYLPLTLIKVIAADLHLLEAMEHGNSRNDLKGIFSRFIRNSTKLSEQRENVYARINYVIEECWKERFLPDEP